MIDYLQHSALKYNTVTLFNYTPKFRLRVNEKLNCNIPLKTTEQIENALVHITQVIQKAAWTSTNTVENRTNRLTYPTYRNKPRSLYIHEGSVGRGRRLRSSYSVFSAKCGRGGGLRFSFVSCNACQIGVRKKAVFVCRSTVRVQ